jgi:acyl-CoA synthetase (NDP forming)
VAKVISPDIVHKSDMGGVLMGLQNQTDIATAVDTLVQRVRDIGARLDGVLLQREVTGGVEALVGVTTDPTFGPLLVCGLGGTLVEIFRDVAFRVPPVTDVDAVEMLAKLHAGRLLDGYRGAPAADRQALIGIILRISALIECIPELRELDLNPIKVRPERQGAIVVDGRMRLSPLTT